MARLNHPAVAILLLAPFFGEALSGSTPPLDLVLPWNLALTMALYGAGALLCREVARRHRLGLVGLCLLGAAYGVYEEGLIDRYWFYPTFWHDAGIGSYSVVAGTNLLLAVHLTVFHTAISICASILLVEHLYPAHRSRPWAGRRGLALAAFALAVVSPLGYAEAAPWPSEWLLAAAGALCLVLVAAALRSRTWTPRAAAGVPAGRRGRIGTIAFAATTAHFASVYGLPSTAVPWPLAILVSLIPVAAGVLVIRRRATGDIYGADALRTIAGMVAFFVLLDALVGLGGRYDMTLGALVTALALRHLLRRDQAPTTRPVATSPEAVSGV